MDTEPGLVGPVIRDADKKSVRDLASEITALAEKARTGELAIDETRGGLAFTPIANYPEAAIPRPSWSSRQPVVRDGRRCRA